MFRSFKVDGRVIEIPNSHLVVSADGSWNIGDQTLFDTQHWSEQDWETFLLAPAEQQLETARRLTNG